MSRVHITQYLCEQRHCILAAAWEEGGSDTRENVEQRIEEAARGMKLNPWCGLCGSTTFHFETGRTKFQTLAEALPHLRVSEILQDQTRRYFATRPKQN